MFMYRRIARLDVVLSLTFICLALTLFSPESALGQNYKADLNCSTVWQTARPRLKVSEKRKGVNVFSEQVSNDEEMIFSIIDSKGCRIEMSGSDISFYPLWEYAGDLMSPYEVKSFEGIAKNEIIQKFRKSATERCDGASSMAVGRKVKSDLDRCLRPLHSELEQSTVIGIISEPKDGKKIYWEVIVHEGRISGALMKDLKTQLVYVDVSYLKE